VHIKNMVNFSYYDYTLKRMLIAGSILSTTSSVASALLVSPTTTAAGVIAMKDYSSIASGLFNNMRTPAALIGGAIVPLGLLTAPPIQKDESAKVQMLKKANVLLAIAALLSELLAITYSTVAINKLAEVKFAPTAGVSELLSKNFELAWIGTNVHFLLGMFGFGLLVGTKAYFLYGDAVGKIAGCWSVAAFLQCTSIVNAGIAMGSGSTADGGGATTRFAANLFSLSWKYVMLVLSKARMRPLSIAAIGVGLYSVFLTVQHLMELFSKSKGHED
jgi:hypothetical protein